MADWERVTLESALAIHSEQLAEYGGVEGFRDEGLFESAMARPIHLAVCNTPDAASLAAAYAYGLARNHAFTDGNKRTASVVSLLFLAKNGLFLRATDPEMFAVILDLAAGELTEQEFAEWLRERVRAA